MSLVAPGFESLTGGRSLVTGVHRGDVGPVAPFAAIELRIDEAGEAGVAAGLLDVHGDGVRVVHEPGRSRIAIVLTLQDRDHVVARRRLWAQRLRGLAFVLCENQVTAVADTGSGWFPVVSARDPIARVLDLRNPATLARHTYAWGTASRARDVLVGGVRAGCFGAIGIRDLHLVQHTDGRPYVRDGLAYLTATCGGPGFFPQAHWGVFTLDLAEPSTLTQVAQLYSRRDGLLLGDHAGQVVVDEDAGTCLVGVSAWGDFDPSTGVHVRWARTGLDVLHGVHVLETERLELPTAVSAWDPAITRIDGRWHVAFVESPSQEPFEFHPALATAETWGRAFERVGADVSMRKCEGVVIARVDGSWRVLASDGAAREYPVYDLGMRRVGSLPAPYGTNIPHPQIVPLPAGSPLGRELLVTFDDTPWGRKVLGYGTHGDVVVMAR